jgi:hypothetical protein
MKIGLKILLLNCFWLLTFSCVKDKALEVQAEDCEFIISYSSQIKPLIQQSCATNLGPGTGCHDAWIFEYENLQAPIESGSFWNVIETRYMPVVPNSFNIEELTPEEIELFRCWIKQGALNN